METGSPINLILRPTLKDPHILARDMVVEIGHPKASKFKSSGILQNCRSPGRIKLPAPVLAQHTDALLKYLLALTDAQIAHRREQKVIEAPNHRNRSGPLPGAAPFGSGDGALGGEATIDGHDGSRRIA